MRKVYKCVTACGLCASGGPIEKTVLYKDDSPAFMGGGVASGDLFRNGPGIEEEVSAIRMEYRD